MAKFRDIEPGDTADWPEDFIIGQPVAGPGSPGVPVTKAMRDGSAERDKQEEEEPQ